MTTGRCWFKWWTTKTALSVLQFMVAKLVFQVECRKKKVAGVFIFCFQFDFSLLVKISRLMLEPCMCAQTGHNQTAQVHIFWRKQGEAAVMVLVLLLHQGCQFMLIMRWFLAWDALELLCLLVSFVVEKHLRPLCYSLCLAELYMHVIKAAWYHMDSWSALRWEMIWKCIKK